MDEARVLEIDTKHLLTEHVDGKHGLTSFIRQSGWLFDTWDNRLFRISNSKTSSACWIRLVGDLRMSVDDEPLFETIEKLLSSTSLESIDKVYAGSDGVALTLKSDNQFVRYLCDQYSTVETYEIPSSREKFLPQSRPLSDAKFRSLVASEMVKGSSNAFHRDLRFWLVPK